MFFDTHNHSQFSFDGEGTTVEKSALAAVEKGSEEYVSPTIVISMSRR